MLRPTPTLEEFIDLAPTLGALAAVPAGPRVPDRGNWLLPTPAALYLASEGRAQSENCRNYGHKRRLAQTKQPLGKEKSTLDVNRRILCY